MNLCKDCRHFILPKEGLALHDFAKCDRYCKTSPVDGSKVWPGAKYCFLARQSDCLNGIHFLPKETIDDPSQS